MICNVVLFSIHDCKLGLKIKENKYKLSIEEATVEADFFFTHRDPTVSTNEGTTGFGDFTHQMGTIGFLFFFSPPVHKHRVPFSNHLFLTHTK